MTSNEQNPLKRFVKVRDVEENYRIHVPDAPSDLPCRIAIAGMSLLSGKTNALINLIGRPYDDSDPLKLYGDKFKPENIYLVSPTAAEEAKWREAFQEIEIPPGNLLPYDEPMLLELVKKIKEDYATAIAEGEKPPHVLVIMDDCTADGSMVSKRHGIMSKLASNLRHNNVSTIVTAQKWTDIPPVFRNQCTGMMLGMLSPAELDDIWPALAIPISKKEWLRVFEQGTFRTDEEGRMVPAAFLIHNPRNPPSKMFYTEDYKYIPWTTTSQESKAPKRSRKQPEQPQQQVPPQAAPTQ